jgi:hypothetical protein
VIVFVMGAAGALFAMPAQAAAPVRAAAVAGSTPDCATVRAQAAELAAAGSTTVACTETLPAGSAAAAAAKAAKAGKGFAAPNALGASCSSSSGTRQSACEQRDGIVTVLTVPELAVVGQIFYTSANEMFVSGRSTLWTHTFSYLPTYSWGAVGDIRIFADAYCIQACVPIGGLFASGSAVSTFGVSGQGRFDSPYRGAGAVWASGSRWSWYFEKPTASPPRTTPSESSVGPARCDDALGITTPVGCAFPSVRPELEVPRSRYPTYARHIELALNFGLQRVLTRTQNQVLTEANRDTACPTGPSYPRPAGFSCDEYPFASTYQGAASQIYGRQFIIIALNTGQSFSCQVPWLPRRLAGDSGGYSACMVPAGENSLGGSDLQAFYIDNRVIELDTFSVRVRG